MRLEGFFSLYNIPLPLPSPLLRIFLIDFISPFTTLEPRILDVLHLELKARPIIKNNIMNKLAIVILAAGKGTRMKSQKAKVLHEAFYQPMVAHVINSTKTLSPAQTIAVVGHQSEDVKNALLKYNIEFVLQKEQRGTGHAVLVTEGEVSHDITDIMILCGDTPLIEGTTLENFYRQHMENGHDITLMTALLDNPANYGRILSDSYGNITGIVEQKDASPEELKIREINAGIYCVKKEFLYSALKNVGTDNNQGEVYLTDIISIGVKKGLQVKRCQAEKAIDVLGVNSRLELSIAERELQLRHNKKIMATGVSMLSPETIRISPDSIIGNDTVIEQCVHIHNNSHLGSGCTIEQGVVIDNCTIGNNVKIQAGNYLREENIPANTVC